MRELAEQYRKGGKKERGPILDEVMRRLRSDVQEGQSTPGGRGIRDSTAPRPP